MTFDPDNFTAADLDELWECHAEDRGPVLLSEGVDLEALPLCGFCSYARWYVIGPTLRVFCKEFRDNMPTNREDGVTRCDTFAIVSGRIKDPAPAA